MKKEYRGLGTGAGTKIPPIFANDINAKISKHRKFSVALVTCPTPIKLK